MQSAVYISLSWIMFSWNILDCFNFYLPAHRDTAQILPSPHSSKRLLKFLTEYQNILSVMSFHKKKYKISPSLQCQLLPVSGCIQKKKKKWRFINERIQDNVTTTKNNQRLAVPQVHMGRELHTRLYFPLPWPETGAAPASIMGRMKRPHSWRHLIPFSTNPLLRKILSFF